MATAGSTAMSTATTIMAEPEAAGGEELVRLLAWLSPSFPIGAFSYSHGLEWVVEDGTVRDAPSLEAWVDGLLRVGSGRSDAVILALTHAHAAAEDRVELAGLAEFALALQPSAERRLEVVSQGNAFLKAVRAGWPAPQFEAFARAWPGDVVYPVAVGLAAAAHGIDRRATLLAYLHAFIANIVSAGIRLVPLGQTAGLEIVAALEGRLAGVADEALALGPDDIGGASFLADIASMRHETQYTRLFRS